MKPMQRAVAVLLCLIGLFVLSACADYSDPLQNSNWEDPNPWVPLLTEEEAAEKFGKVLARTQPMSDYSSRVYGDYYYYSGSYTYLTDEQEEISIATLMRYNLRTGTSEPACRDAACTHQSGSGCPFVAVAEAGNIVGGSSGITNMMVWGDTLYYRTASFSSDGLLDTSVMGGIHSYNLETMAYKYLCDVDPVNGGNLDVYEDKVYFTKTVYGENGPEKLYVSVCDGESGKTEELFSIGRYVNGQYEGPTPFVIDEKGRMLFYQRHTDYFAPETANVTYTFSYRELKKDAEAVVFGPEVTICQDIHSYNSIKYSCGKIFFMDYLETEELFSRSEQTEMYQLCMRYDIRCLDIETGTLETITDQVSKDYIVAGDYLYYLPYTPESVEFSDYNVAVFATRGKIIQVNIRTGEEKEFSVDSDLELSGSSGIIGKSELFYYRGRLFLRAENQKNGDSYFAEYDFATQTLREVRESIVANL